LQGILINGLPGSAREARTLVSQIFNAIDKVVLEIDGVHQSVDTCRAPAARSVEGSYAHEELGKVLAAGLLSFEEAV
jgi:hypothetical protein